MCPGVGPEGCLRQFPYPLVALVCRGHVQVPCWCCQPPDFAPDSSEVAVELSGLSVSPSPDLLQLRMYGSYFQSLTVCLNFVAWGDFFPSIAAKGPRSQLVSEWAGMVLKFPKCTIIYFQMLHIIYFFYICILNSENAKAAFWALTVCSLFGDLLWDTHNASKVLWFL